MKKIFFLILIAFLWNNLALAEKSCEGKLKNSPEIVDDFMVFNFRSSCEHDIYIKFLNVKTKDRKIIYEEKVDLHIIPYGIKRHSIYIGNLNKEVIKKAGYKWSLTPPQKTSSPKTFNQNKNKSPKVLKPDNYGYPNEAWGPIALIFIIVLFVGIFHKQIFSSLFKKTKIKKTKLKIGNDIFSDIWDGRLPLSKVFWIYFVLINIAFSFVVTLISYAVGMWIIVFIAIYNIWSGVGVWKSATNYKIEKLNSKKPYGYATAAQIYLIFNVVVLLSQLGLAIR